MTINLGAYASEIVRGGIEAIPRGQIEAGRALQCLPDLITPDDIANLALFLGADDSRLITKQCIAVNGGVL